MKSFSLIVPAHNSGKVIEKSIREYYNFFSKKFKKIQIIVVCNDCTDNTPKIIQNLSKKLPVKVIEIPQRGKGYALIAGFNNANGDYIGFLDADNPFNLTKVLEMINHLESYDIVLASKYLRGTKRVQDSIIRRFLSLGGFIVSKILFNLEFRDTQAGAKFFKKEVWKEIGNHFTCTGFDFDIEFLYRAKKKKYRFAEKYLPFKYEKFSTFRLKYLPGMLKRLFVLRFLR